MYSVGSPWRDKQQDPWCECSLCGAEVYVLPSWPIDIVICDECAEKEVNNERNDIR